jgi:hypothetical protein
LVLLGEEEAGSVCNRREGSLDDVPFAMLLAALCRRKRNLTLSISRPPKVKEIIFEGGVPVHCRSNLAHETLSRFMQSTGALDEGAANECFAESCARGVRFGDILIERRLITPEELRRVLQKSLARKLLDGFSWRQGSYRLSELPPEVDSSLRVNVAQLIILGVTRFASQEQVDTAIAPLIGQPLTLQPKPSLPLDDTIMSSRQQSIVTSIAERPQRIDELAELHAIEFRELSRLLYALSLIGAVVPVSAVANAAKPAPPPSSNPPTRPATRPQTADVTAKEAAPAEPVVTRELRDELVELALNYRRKDPFELLRIDPDDFGRQTHDRFLFFAERYAPWRYPQDLRDDARRIFLAGARAYGAIADPERRSLLVERRRAELRTPESSGADAFRIETALLDPEVQYRKGRALTAEGNYRDALEQLEYASDLDPQNGKYRAERAYCRYLCNPQAGAAAALEELDRALRIDPASGLVHYYRGEILRVLGRVDEAEESLRRSIRPMAPDRRPIEALRALRRERSK